MRHLTILLLSGALAASLLAGCNDNPTTAPTTGGGGAVTPPTSGGTPTTPPSGGSPAPATAAVTVGDIFFKSDLNGSSNPAVDTVAVSGTVTWTWATTEALPHSVQSTGSPSFTSSGIQTGSGNTYQFTFTAPGTYQYDCAVHGQMMTGTIVVMAVATAPSNSTPATTPPSMPPASTSPPTGY
jgi:plastocyanin